MAKLAPMGIEPKAGSSIPDKEAVLSLEIGPQPELNTGSTKESESSLTRVLPVEKCAPPGVRTRSQKFLIRVRNHYAT